MREFLLPSKQEITAAAIYMIWSCNLVMHHEQLLNSFEVPENIIVELEKFSKLAWNQAEKSSEE